MWIPDLFSVARNILWQRGGVLHLPLMTERLTSVDQWLLLVPVKGGIGSIFDPPEGKDYKWHFSCQLGDGLCHRSHLLREPKTTIDSTHLQETNMSQLVNYIISKKVKYMREQAFSTGIYLDKVNLRPKHNIRKMPGTRLQDFSPSNIYNLLVQESLQKQPKLWICNGCKNQKTTVFVS